MSGLSERDWELVNAHHDGELGQEERRAFEARLGQEPALAAALDSVREISGSLGALRPALKETYPATSASSPANRNRHVARWWIGGAVAAGLAVAIVFGSGQFTRETPYDIHRELAAESFAVDAANVRRAATVSGVGVPDLAAANLAPVAFRTFEDGSLTHYTGANGCRLTYFRARDGLDAMPRPDGYRSASWTTSDGLHHAVIATGMDQNKFDAIAAYLSLVTRQETSGEVVAALSEATRAAGPCVG